jgi:hypothetical protein
MNLRLYSDVKSLTVVAETLQIPRQIVHIKGEPMSLTGRFAGRIAKSHYVSFEETKTDDETDLAPWIEETVAAVLGAHGLVDDLREQRVTATLWIAMFGEDPTPAPTVPADVVDKVADCGAQLFLENYTMMDPEHGNAQKHWLANPPKFPFYQ